MSNITIDKNLINRISIFVSKLIERSLTNLEENNLISFVYENKDFVETDKVVNFVSVIAYEYAQTLNANNTLTANVTSVLGIDNLPDFITTMVPQITKKTAYLCLDSRYAEFLSDNTKLRWSIINNIDEYGTTASLLGEIRNVTRIRCASIVTRKFSSTMARASILIEEIIGQSFLFPGGRRFHFLALLNDLQNPVSVAARSAVTDPAIWIADFTIYNKYELLMGYRFNEGNYRFNLPITTLDYITISIADPITPLAIPKYEYFNVTLTPNSTYFTLTFDEPHYLIPNVSYGDNPMEPGTPYDLFIDDVIVDDEIDQWYADLLTGKEWAIVEYIDANTLRVYHKAYAFGFSPDNVPGELIYPIPVQSTFKVRVRNNSFRIIYNLEVEYLG